MRIAIVGTGISGLVCGRVLTREHDVTLYEAASRVGGHANTVAVQLDGESHQIDTGFIVYNDRTYPVFSRMLQDLDVETTETSMSFSIKCDRSGLEYCGTSLNGLFAQRRNLLRPSFLRMLRDIVRFNREGSQDAASTSAEMTVAEYLTDRGYSQQFADQYLLPMGAAIWSCPCDDFAGFPIRFILEFYINHGLLSLRDRPVWRTVKGGSAEYVKRLVSPFADSIRLKCPVFAVKRHHNGVVVQHRQGTDHFDEVIFACHSDQALTMLSDADKLETEMLSAFPYSANTAILHTDESVLPLSRRAWSSWNYHIPRHSETRPAVTYNMSILQHIQSSRTFCVTLNEDELIDQRSILGEYQYSHPLFTVQRAAVQRRHAEVIRRRNTSFCGAYWRNGFHEDGVISGLAVCKQFGIPGWTANTSTDSDLDRDILSTALSAAPSTVGGV